MGTQNEYTNKYWCEYCRIFIQNNKISRKNHEQSGGHKGAVQRNLRNIYKKKDIEEKQNVKNAKILAQIDRAAAKAMGQPIAYRKEIPASQSAGSSNQPPKISAKIDISNYGYGDSTVYQPPEEWKPEEFKATASFLENNQRIVESAKIGEWEVVEEEEEYVPDWAKEPSSDVDQNNLEENEPSNIVIASSNRVEDPDDEEDEQNVKDSKKYELVEKKLEVSEDESKDTPEPVFKKRKMNKNTRKK
ncbi:hypothetical protein BC833DRAFT_602675 [Globomyces pollinis-pini]|nr:hypothetical protein BC833DRAFT_602675 [Globomyces pollinis-pini]